jgi:hypothetical protein
LRNINATVTTAATTDVSPTAKTITGSGTTFNSVTGFVAGNQIVVSYTDDASAAIRFTARITSVTDLVIRYTWLAGSTPTVANDKAVTVTSKDEFNYCTTGAVSLTPNATALTFTRASGSFITDGFVYGTIFTTDATHNPGPYKVEEVTALVLTVSLVGTATMTTETAETMTLTNGYVSTGGEQTVTFTIDGDEVILNPFDLSSFGLSPLDTYSPGMIIYDDLHAADDTTNLVICYASFDPWTLQF